MTKDQVIQMANEAGLVDWEASAYLNELQSFAAFAAQHERERIAKKIEQLPFGDTSASFAIYVRENA